MLKQKGSVMLRVGITYLLAVIALTIYGGQV